MFYDRTRKRWHFNAGGCLIEVTACAGLTVFTFYCNLHLMDVDQQTSQYHSIIFTCHEWGGRFVLSNGRYRYCVFEVYVLERWNIAGNTGT